MQTTLTLKSMCVKVVLFSVANNDRKAVGADKA